MGDEHYGDDFRMVELDFFFITPFAPSCQVCYLLDNKHFRAAIKYSEAEHVFDKDFIVEMWSNLYHKEYSEGDWHAIPMKLLSTEKLPDSRKCISYFGVDLIVTCLGSFEFTYRGRHKDDPNFKWAKYLGCNGRLEIKRQTDHLTTYVQESKLSKVTHNIYVGNFTAALEAHLNGFDALLNVSNDAPVYAKQLSRPIILKKLPIAFGVDVVIGENMILEAVFWLRAMSDLCSKILIASRDGHGRAGSIMISFIFAMNPNLTFDEAYKFVNDRHFVYPHKGLRESLNRIYIRE
ncbi:uncharacterized protein LOC131940800 [Physella acuta]|uniref:uncharacterized protein LOC131940800 n=1 Tax=Physella acuta TaxID=109671 RepID=UPI0027DCF069|nr:uncharacterized protein LOC131940800 [Physella acuta]